MSIRAGLIGGLVGALVAGGVGAAVAVPMISSAAAPTVLGACANKTTGAMRLATKAGDCARAERFVSWNQEGPAGPQGARGAAGARGEAGPSGAAGAQGERGPSDVWVAQSDYVFVPVGGEEGTWDTWTPVATIADLPAGKYLLRLTGNAQLPTPGTLMLQCAIGTSTAALRDVRASGGDAQVMSIEYAVDLATTTSITARCITGDTRGAISFPMLTATAVGAFHTTGP